MPYKLTTTINKISLVPNAINLNLLLEFHAYMKSKGCSERHQNNTLQVMVQLANFLGRDRTFYGIEKKEEILEFLDTKKKNLQRTLTRNGLLHGITILLGSNYFSVGSSIERTKELMRLNGKRPPLLE